MRSFSRSMSTSSLVTSTLVRISLVSREGPLEEVAAAGGPPERTGMLLGFAAAAAALPSRELLARSCGAFRRGSGASAATVGSVGRRDEAAAVVRSEAGAVLREAAAAADEEPAWGWSWRLDEVLGGATGGRLRRRSGDDDELPGW